MTDTPPNETPGHAREAGEAPGETPGKTTAEAPGEAVAVVDSDSVLRACDDDYEWPLAWMGVFLRGLRAQPNVSAAARMAGTSRARVYVARRTHPVFAEAWDDAMQQAVDLLGGFAHRLATTGVQTTESRRVVKRELDPTTGRLRIVEETEVTTTGTMISPNMTKFLLQVHAPEVYNRPERREITGAGGGPIEVHRLPTAERVLELARIAIELESDIVDGEAEEETDEYASAQA